MKFVSTLFSKTGFLLLAYFAVGIAVGPPGGLAGVLLGAGGMAPEQALSTQCPAMCTSRGGCTS